MNVRSVEQMPSLIPATEWVWSAWETLTQKRTWGPELPDPIPTSEILAYAEYHEIPRGVLREDLFYLISAMDYVFLSFCRSEKQKKDGKNRRQRASRPPPTRRRK